MKNIILASLCTLLVLFFSSCFTNASSANYGYQPPSRPILSSQERANLTEEDIYRIIVRGDVEFDKGNYTGAKDLYYEAILALHEPNVYVLSSYGACLRNLGLYQNAISIFNMVLEDDPYDESARNNIAFCRQQIARQTEAQRQLELEQQRFQQENFNNLISSLNAMSNTLAGMAQQEQNRQSRGNASTSGSSSASSSSGSSSERRSNYDITAKRRNYRQYAAAAEAAYEAVRSSSGGIESTSSRQRYVENQRRMREIREEAARHGLTIDFIDWETKPLPR